MAAQEIQIPDAATRAAALSADMNPQSPLPPGAAQELTDIQGERMVLNMGPSHPATHGVLRLILELDGERTGWIIWRPWPTTWPTRWRSRS